MPTSGRRGTGSALGRNPSTQISRPRAGTRWRMGRGVYKGGLDSHLGEQSGSFLPNYTFTVRPSHSTSSYFPKKNDNVPMRNSVCEHSQQSRSQQPQAGSHSSVTRREHMSKLVYPLTGPLLSSKRNDLPAPGATWVNPESRHANEAATHPDYVHMTPYIRRSGKGRTTGLEARGTHSGWGMGMAEYSGDMEMFPVLVVEVLL